MSSEGANTEDLGRRLLADAALSLAAGGAAASPEEARRALATFLARFEPQEPIGRGGSGEVFRALDRHLGRECAVKRVRARGPWPRVREIRERFHREVEVLRELRHPGIPAVYDGVVAGSELWLAMELVPGRTLAAVLADPRPPSLAERVRLVRETALILHHAHERGVVHRDLKPGNVLVGDDGRPRVVDFGIAKALEGADDLTGSGVFLGTAAYASPEQLRGDSRSVDARSDVWSLGAVLHEALAGARPFAAEDVPTLARLVRETRPASLRSLEPRIPAGLEAVVLRALAREPADRFASALDLARALEPWTREDAWLAPASAPAASGLAGPGRVLVLGLGIGLGIGLCALGLALLGREGLGQGALGLRPPAASPPVFPAASPFPVARSPAPPSGPLEENEVASVERALVAWEARTLARRDGALEREPLERGLERLARFPGSPAACELAARLHGRLGHLQRAVATLDSAVHATRAAPGSAVLFRRAVARWDLLLPLRWEDETGVALDPELDRVRADLARARAGEGPEARRAGWLLDALDGKATDDAALAALLADDPAFAGEGQRLLGDVWLVRGEPARALECFESVLAREPLSPTGHAGRQLAFVAGGSRDPTAPGASLDAFVRAVDADPGSPALAFAFAEVMKACLRECSADKGPDPVRQGTSGLVTKLGRARSVNPEEPLLAALFVEALVLEGRGAVVLGEAWANRGGLAHALAECEAYPEETTRAFGPDWHLAVAEAHVGRAEGPSRRAEAELGRDHARRFLDCRPGDRWGGTQLAIALDCLGRTDEAAKVRASLPAAKHPFPSADPPRRRPAGSGH